MPADDTPVTRERIDSSPSVFEISTEDGHIVATLPFPDEDEDHVEIARIALNAMSASTGWYGLSTAHGPTNPDGIEYVSPVQVTRDEHGRQVWQHRFPTAEERAAARAEHAAPLMADPFAGLVLADDELAF